MENILHVRTMPGAYIIAMKLASLRPYKYDRSDIIGVISEEKISKEDIITDDSCNIRTGFLNYPDT